MVTAILNSLVLAYIDDLVASLGGAGAKLKIYDDTSGTPATTDASIGSAVLLATGTLNATPFGAAADTNPGGEAVANAIATFQGVAAGTAKFFRLTDASDNVKHQGECGLSGSGKECIMTNLSIGVGQDINVSSLKIVVPETFGT